MCVCVCVCESTVKQTCDEMPGNICICFAAILKKENIKYNRLNKVLDKTNMELTEILKAGDSQELFRRVLGFHFFSVWSFRV